MLSGIQSQLGVEPIAYHTMLVCQAGTFTWFIQYVTYVLHTAWISTVTTKLSSLWLVRGGGGGFHEKNEKRTWKGGFPRCWESGEQGINGHLQPNVCFVLMG